MNKRWKLEVIMISLYFIFLLGVLAVKYKTIQTLSDLFIYGSTWILLLHIWWGAFIVIKYLKVKMNILNYTLEISMLAILLFVLYDLNDKKLWALLFSLFFFLVMGWYLLLHSLVHKDAFKIYTKKKIQHEIVAIPLFLLLSLFFGLFESEEAYLVLSSITFAVQLFFIITLFIVKKVYKIVKN